MNEMALPPRELARRAAASAAPAALTLLLGSVGLLGVILGTLALQVYFAATHVPPSASVVARFPADAPGVKAVCRIVGALASRAETAILVASLVAGLLAALIGVSVYRRMETRRRRRRCVTGAILGIQAVVLAVFLLWFRKGDTATFAYQFLNFSLLSGQLGPLLNGMKNTILLALIGEAGGLVIGLLLALLSLAKYRAARAPARVFINFFRGTPLIWQLSFVYFGFALGFQLPLNAYQAAILTFCMNIGAYSAEVLRAGIQSVERGQMEAARGLGFSYLGTMRYAILPQAFRRVIPPLLNEFVGLIKDTSLIIVLGLTASQQDLFTAASMGYSSTFNATFFIAAAIGYLAITLPLIRLVNAAESRMRSGMAGLATG